MVAEIGWWQWRCDRSLHSGVSWRQSQKNLPMDYIWSVREREAADKPKMFEWSRRGIRLLLTEIGDTVEGGLRGKMESSFIGCLSWQLDIHLRCQRNCCMYWFWHLDDRLGLKIYIQDSADSNVILIILAIQLVENRCLQHSFLLTCGVLWEMFPSTKLSCLFSAH